MGGFFVPTDRPTPNRAIWSLATFLIGRMHPKKTVGHRHITKLQMRMDHGRYDNILAS